MTANTPKSQQQLRTAVLTCSGCNALSEAKAKRCPLPPRCRPVWARPHSAMAAGRGWAAMAAPAALRRWWMLVALGGRTRYRSLGHSAPWTLPRGHRMSPLRGRGWWLQGTGLPPAPAVRTSLRCPFSLLPEAAGAPLHRAQAERCRRPRPALPALLAPCCAGRRPSPSRARRRAASAKDRSS